MSDTDIPQVITTYQTEEIELKIPSYPPNEIMRVDLDGGFRVNESIPATDAAREVLRLMKEQWFYDKQATKIRELQERIKRLEEAGNPLCAAGAFMGWHDKVEAWRKAKEDKP